LGSALLPRGSTGAAAGVAAGAVTAGGVVLQPLGQREGVGSGGGDAGDGQQAGDGNAGAGHGVLVADGRGARPLPAI
jgi:hypothetical protein